MEAIDLTVIDQFLKLFMEAVNSAAQPLADAGGDVMRAIIWISVIMAVAAFTLGRSFEGGLGTFWSWMFRIYIVGYLGANWPAILVDGLAGIVGLGASAGG